MNDEQFNILQNKLEEINRNLLISHNRNYNLNQTIHNRQIRLEKILGIENAQEPFTPFYNRSIDIIPNYPEIFNKYGEKMEVFFISDRQFANIPNRKNQRYVIWDRYNYGLKTHFYSHDEMFRTVGKPERKFGILFEPRAILPQSYENIINNKDYIEKNFDAVFTYDAQLLSTLKNAKFANMVANVLYGRNKDGDYFYGKKSDFSNDDSIKDSFIICEDNYKHKNKNISMICSAKEMCEGHRRRKKLAFKVRNEKLADTFGQFDGGGTFPLNYRLKITDFQ